MVEQGILFITDISAGTYIFALAISVVTAMVAVVSQTLATTQANPVHALRNE